jgi:hypothetical protein
MALNPFLCLVQTDKASLLAEVIEHVKELKRQTAAVLDASERVHTSASQQQQFRLPPTSWRWRRQSTARDDSSCARRCAARIERASSRTSPARRAEIATLGGRIRNVLLITADDDDEGQADRDDDAEGDDDDGWRCAAAAPPHRRHELVASVQEALRGVMGRKAASSDASSSSGNLKRQRVSGGSHDRGSL